MNTTRRNVNAPSTMSRKVGFKDEPGLRMVEKEGLHRVRGWRRWG